MASKPPRNANVPVATTVAPRSGCIVDWTYALVIAAAAIIVRLIFPPGGLGSDETVYITQALHLLSGDWGHSTYIGAIRYGINIPLALSIRLLGKGVVGAGGLFFTCSIAEILLGYWFAHHLWGRAAAIWSALALTVLPISVRLAGSLLPDPYLALCIELSIITFYFAQRGDNSLLYLIAGLLAGWVFWIKEAVIVYGLLFVLLAIQDRRFRMGWLWFLTGGALCGLGNLAQFWIMYGNALFPLDVLRQTVATRWVGEDIFDTSLSTYFTLLLVKIYHTGLLGWLALAGGISAFPRRREPDISFVLVWTIGLLVIFSAFPISFAPLKFIGKQASYMAIFTMPLALLAGWFLSIQRLPIAMLLGGAMIVSGFLLSAMEQQVIRTVTENGRLASQFSVSHTPTPVFGPRTAQRQSALARLLQGSLDMSGNIRPLDDLKQLDLGSGAGSELVAYVIDDPQAINWLPADEIGGVFAEKLRHCWKAVGRLDPTSLGFGRPVIGAIRGVASVLPATLGDPMLRATDPFYRIAPATVYAVSRECVRGAND